MDEVEVKVPLIGPDGTEAWRTIMTFVNPDDTLEDLNNRILDDIQTLISVGLGDSDSVIGYDTMEDSFGNVIYDIHAFHAGEETFSYQ